MPSLPPTNLQDHHHREVAARMERTEPDDVRSGLYALAIASEIAKNNDLDAKNGKRSIINEQTGGPMILNVLPSMIQQNGSVEIVRVSAHGNMKQILRVGGSGGGGGGAPAQAGGSITQGTSLNHDLVGQVNLSSGGDAASLLHLESSSRGVPRHLGVHEEPRSSFGQNNPNGSYRHQVPLAVDIQGGSNSQRQGGTPSQFSHPASSVKQHSEYVNSHAVLIHDFQTAQQMHAGLLVDKDRTHLKASYPSSSPQPGVSQTAQLQAIGQRQQNSQAITQQQQSVLQQQSMSHQPQAMFQQQQQHGIAQQRQQLLSHNQVIASQQQTVAKHTQQTVLQQLQSIPQQQQAGNKQTVLTAQLYQQLINQQLAHKQLSQADQQQLFQLQRNHQQLVQREQQQLQMMQQQHPELSASVQQQHQRSGALSIKTSPGGGSAAMCNSEAVNWSSSFPGHGNSPLLSPQHIAEHNPGGSGAPDVRGSGVDMRRMVYNEGGSTMRTTTGQVSRGKHGQGMETVAQGQFDPVTNVDTRFRPQKERWDHKGGNGGQIWKHLQEHPPPDVSHAGFDPSGGAQSGGGSGRGKYSAALPISVDKSESSMAHVALVAASERNLQNKQHLTAANLIEAIIYHQINKSDNDTDPAEYSTDSRPTSTVFPGKVTTHDRAAAAPSFQHSNNSRTPHSVNSSWICGSPNPARHPDAARSYPARYNGSDGGGVPSLGERIVSAGKHLPSVDTRGGVVQSSPAPAARTSLVDAEAGRRSSAQQKLSSSVGAGILAQNRKLITLGEHIEAIIDHDIARGGGTPDYVGMTCVSSLSHIFISYLSHLIIKCC